MKEKKSAAKQVAEMTQQQKSTVLKIGVIVDAIAIVLIVAAMLLWIPAFVDAREATNNAKEIFEEISEKNDLIMEETERLNSLGGLHLAELIPYDEADKAWEEADEANLALVIKGVIVGVSLVAYGVIILVFVKKKYPYYSDGAFFYLLFGKDKKTA